MLSSEYSNLLQSITRLTYPLVLSISYFQMDCGQCSIQLVPQEDLCFYYKREKVVELMIKHEKSTFYEDKFKFKLEKGERFNIFCLSCSSKIGTKHVFGPHHAEVMAFGQRVRVLDRKLNRNDRWYHLYKTEYYAPIPIRYTDSFYGYKLNEMLPCDIPRCKVTDPIKWPNPLEVSNFTYDDIIMSDVVPRDYQLTAYIEALQRDFVLVLPTGYGKTLVANLVAGRMKKLNPAYMVLFLVDRIPLVFQQAESISTDTHLRVCPITSESNTNRKRRQLNQGAYDVMVSTAGAYLALERDVNIQRFCLIIFDECHHATKSHDYVLLLKLIRDSATDDQNRPRVLGLTASPPSTKGNEISTKQLLDDFKIKFFNAPICHNLSLVNYEFADAKIDKKIISEDPVWGLRNYLQKLEKELYLLADKINSYYGVERITKSDWIESKNRIQLMTMLYHLKLNNDVMIEECVESMKKICKALDITELLGVTDAHYMVADVRSLSELSSERILSPRVSKLFAILKDLSQNSKIIVFVKTRRVAHLLTNILKENPEINKKFCPLKIIGQSGPFGMSWLNEQDEVIEKFRHGNCNLLVSTSVLEEGIDNPDCDIVIRFDGVKSLISFTQSKGRARKWEKSKFILLMSEEEENFLVEIQEHDVIVKKVLSDSYNDNDVPSKCTLKIQREIFEKISPPPIRELECSVKSSECAVEFYLTGSHELFDIQDRIADILFTKYFLRVKLIDQANCNSLWKSRNIFPQADSLLVLGLKTQTPNIYQRYKLLCVDWSFFLHKIKSSVWTRVVLPTKHGLEIHSKWSLKMVSWGVFTDKQIFELKESYEPGKDGIFDFFHNNSIQLSLPICQLIIDIPLTSIHRFILCTWTETDVTLYIPLIHCPIIRNKLGERKSCLNCELLTYFAEYPVVSISLSYTKYNWSQLWTFLHSSTIFPVPIFESRVVERTDTIQSDKDEFIDQAFEDERLQNCLWQFSVLKSQRTICLPEETIADMSCKLLKANTNNIHAFTIALSNILLLISETNAHYFFNVQKAFDDKLVEMMEQPGLNTAVNLPKNFRYIETAMVTPSSIVPLQPLLTQCNRLYRRFENERFLNVAFCEEHGEPLRNADVIDRVKNILVSGIELNGSIFHFLVSSGSQLRSKKAIFILIRKYEDPSDKLKTIRSILMGSSVVSNEIKYLTRLGLFCTSDISACEIDSNETLMLPDLLADNGDNLTDGNGKIRKTLAKKILEDITLKNNPTIRDTTALQIRLAGLKGVLTIVDEEMDIDFKKNPNCTIIYRNSMEKIEWTDSALCIVKIGKYNKLFLNTQVLTLLTSLRDSAAPQWDPKIKLRAIFKQTLENNAKLFTNLDIAVTAIAYHFPNYPRKASEHFDIHSEPYFLSLLRCIYTYRINNLIKKFHIPIMNGCLLMGIPDPIGVLEDGEVFITYEENPSHPSLIRRLTGRVLVYKNPCLHPGDLLTPTAVDKEELHSLHNVIVFPVKGSRSLPASSGGGDLDGDEFGIIWDKDLIPPETATFQSLNYNKVLEEYRDKLKAERPDDVSEAGTVVDRNIPLHLDDNAQSILANSYCQVISNQLLGVISHYHLAISDLKEEGARDELAIDLSKLASLAVDAPKTGIFPTIPDKASRLIRDKGYPDFMEKTENTSYPSEKLLGDLYHEARAVCFKTNEWKNILKYHSKRDLKERLPGAFPVDVFKVPGYEVYIKDARKRYFEYTNALRTIMLSLGIRTEAEVVLSLIIQCHPLLSADKGKIMRVLEAATSHLTQEFREIFYKHTADTDYKQKASAWYLTAYHQQTEKSDGLISLSFPWIVGEHLCEIVSMHQQPMPEKHSLHCLLGSSARKYILQHRGNITNLVEKKSSLLPNIESIINQYAAKFCKVMGGSETQNIFKVEAYGSVSKYLCELQSDLDICVSLTESGSESIPEAEKFKSLDIRKQRKHILKSFISPPLCCIANTKIEKFNVGFPFLNCTVDSPDEKCTEMSVDITVDSDGVLKAEYIRQLYRTTGGVFFAFLWILIHWARHVGILKSRSSPNSTCLLITAQFEALVLHIYSEMQSKPEPVDCGDVDSDLEYMLNMLNNTEIDKVLGVMLEEFFWLGYQVTSRNVLEVVYMWPIQGEPTHKIEKAALDAISSLLFQGWHCLVFTRDMAMLFEQARMQLSFNKRFSTYMSNCLRTSTNFFENTLSNITGAQVKIDVRDRYVFLTAHGTASAIHRLSIEVSQIESNTAITNNFRSRINHYILEGSLALVMYGFPVKSKVWLDNFEHGFCREHHIRYNKNVLKSANETLLDDWEKEATTKIQSLLCNQLSHFPGSNPNMVRNLKLITRFGYFYILEGLDSFHSIGTAIYLDDFEKCLLKGKHNRKFDSIGEDINSLSEYFKYMQLSSPKLPQVLEQTESISAIDEKTLTKALSCAYCPGIKSTNGMSHTEVIFTKSLHQCGFVCEDRSNSLTWMICIQATLTRSIRIILDENLKLIDVSESPLVWMLATILANRIKLDPPNAHDLRIRVETTTPLEKNSYFYNSLFPDASNPSILHINEKGLPVVNDDISEKLKIIKHYSNSKFYKLNNTIAKLARGTEYCQQNLVVGREFCELSLYHNESELREAVKSGSVISKIKDIAAEAVAISLKLSNAIYSNMN